MRRIFTAILLFFISISAFGQKSVIRGYVIDAKTNQPVVGIKVFAKGTDFYAYTGNTGRYSLFFPDSLQNVELQVADSLEIIRTVISGKNYNLFVKRPTQKFYALTLKDIYTMSVVTASKRSEPLRDAPTAIDVLYSEDLAAISANRLVDALEYVTGVSSVNGEANFFTATTIRGNTRVNYNTNTTLLYDGIQIYNPYNGSFDFQIIPLSSIDRVEIVKGSESVLYGSNAINGAINVIPRDYLPDKDKMPATDFGARFNYGSYTTSGSNFYLNSRNGDFAFNIYGDLYTKKGEKLTFVDEQLDTLTYRRGYLGYNFAFNLIYRDVKAGFVAYRRREPVVRTRGFSRIYLFPGDTLGVPQPEINDEGMMVVYLNYKKSLAENAQIMLKSSLEKWQNYKYLPDAYWFYSSFGTFNTLEFRLDGTTFGNNLAGISLNHYIARRYKSDQGVYDIGKDNIFTTDFALYYRGDYQAEEFLKFSYGLRYFLSKYGEHRYNDFSPRFAAVLNLNDLLTTKIIYGQSFRVPTYFEKEVASETVVGNPDLKPEKSHSFDWVFTAVNQNLQANIDFYYFVIKNQIDRTVYPLDTNLRINQNVGARLYRGVEFTTHYKLQFIYGMLGYTYVLGTDLVTREPLKYTYNHMFTLVSSVDLTKYLYVDLSAKYLSKWGSAPSYLLLNGSFSLKPFVVPLYFSFKVENILNQEIYLPEVARESPLVPYFPKTMGRSYYVSLHYNFYRR